MPTPLKDVFQDELTMLADRYGLRLECKVFDKDSQELFSFTQNELSSVTIIAYEDVDFPPGTCRGMSSMHGPCHGCPDSAACEGRALIRYPEGE